VALWTRCQTEPGKQKNGLRRHKLMSTLAYSAEDGVVMDYATRLSPLQPIVVDIARDGAIDKSPPVNQRRGDQ